MRVGVDYTSGATQVAGIGRSVRELVAAILRRADCPQLTLLYAHRGPLPAVEDLAASERVRVRRIPVSPPFQKNEPPSISGLNSGRSKESVDLKNSGFFLLLFI